MGGTSTAGVVGTCGVGTVTRRARSACGFSWKTTGINFEVLAGLSIIRSSSSMTCIMPEKEELEAILNLMVGEGTGPFG